MEMVAGISVLQSRLLTQYNARYYGAIKGRIPHGLGIIDYGDGKYDIGTFIAGVIDGSGRLSMQNGDIYEGAMLKGQLNGKVLTIKNCLFTLNRGSSGKKP